MKETIAKIKVLMKSLDENLDKTFDGNKSAAARVRKLTLEFEKLGKSFRRESIAEMK